MAPAGQRDLSSVHLTRHARDRFVERFGGDPDPDVAEVSLRAALGRTRRLGRNARNGAIAFLALHEGQVLVAIVQEATCLTVLTWPQFEPHLSEFGRPRLPRKWGRTLRRLVDPPDEADGSTDST